MKRPLIYHPLLFGLVPLLALLAGNLDQIRPAAALRSGLAALALCVLVWGGLRLALRSWGRAAPLASLWLIFFYTYGHLYEQLEGHTLLGAVVGKHRYLFPLWLGLVLLGTLLLLRAGVGRRASTPGRPAAPPMHGLNQILNAAALALVIFPLMQIGQFAWRSAQPSAALAQAQPAAGGAGSDAGSAAGEQTPNIYYIVLDGYSRADVMREIYDLDITPFMEELRSLGFVLPDCAQSNYGLTPFSMFSALNMEYLDALGPDFPLGSSANEVDTIPMHEYLRDSQARRFLAGRGYQMVTFETGYWWLDIEDADFFIVGNDNPMIKYSRAYEVSNFETIFLRTTALRLVSEIALNRDASRGPRIRSHNQSRYEITTFAMQQLEEVPRIPGKKFVYFHLMAPHEPFVFDAQGNFVDYDRRSGVMPAYPDEVTFLNRRVLEIIRGILAAEETPPIIILQSDHGWDPRYRMRILNALYLPGVEAARIAPEHTPVNTFRLIFNHYFGASYPLLENRSYFSIDGEFPEYGIESFPYRLTPVPTTCMSQ
jgi:hypothetical protein